MKSEQAQGTKVAVNGWRRHARRGTNPGRGTAAVLVAAMIMIFVSLPASGGEGDRQLVREIELRPSANAEVLLSDVRARLWSDGSMDLTVKDSVDAQSVALDGEPIGVRIRIEPNTETYLTEAMTSGEVDALLEQASQLEQTTEGDAAKESFIGSESPDGVHPKALAPPNTSARKISVLMVTTEIAGAIVAQTEYERAWRVANPIQEMYAWERCTPAFSTFLGTHWFNDFCLLLGTWNLGSFNCRSALAGYSNWDFWCNCEPTYADHYLDLCGDPAGNGAYALTWYHYGEWSWLLTGYAYVLWFTSV